MSGKKQNPALNELKKKYETILSSIGDPIAIKDLDFRVIFENEAHTNLLGKHEGEICYKAYHGREEKCENCPVAMAYNDGLVHTIERTRLIEDATRCFEITASPLKDDKGNTIAGIEVIRDITERKTMEHSLMDGNRLLSSIGALYSAFFETSDYEAAFNSLMRILLELTDSEYGFIAEVLYTDADQPYLKMHAMTNISWNNETRALYAKYSKTGFELNNLETLFGVALRTGKAYISNNPSIDPKRGGLPHGHPTINSFLGIPLRRGDAVVGLVGIANRPGGYNERIVSYLDIYLKTCANIIDSYRNETDRKKAETNLKTSEKHFRDLFENSPVSIWEEDYSEVKMHIESLRKQGVSDFGSYLAKNQHEIHRCASLVRIANVNNATLKLYEAGSKEELCEGLHKVFKPASEKAFAKGLAAFASGKTSYECEAINSTLKGNELIQHMKWSIMPGYEDNWSKVLITMNDLTALRRAEEYLKRILETVDEGFVVLDGEFNIITANRAYSERLKTSEIEIKGKKCYEVMHKKSRPCFDDGEDCPVAKTLETGQPHTALHVHEDADGNRHFAELKSYPLKDSSGKVISTIETLVDISEKLKLQEELIKAQKLESVGLLAGGIAHDFNNLLMGVFGHISLAKLTADSATRASIDEAEKALSRARGLTQQLLTFSRGGEPMKKTVNLRPLLYNAVNFALSGSSISYRALIADDLRPVDIDEGQVSQVIHNILINAVEAMPDGGTITVTADNIQIKKDAHPFLKAGHGVAVSIKDTGIGIPEEYLSKIFDPYFTTKHRGSGIGLAASYSIISRHGGSIGVESRPGQGSTFTIHLPASDKQTTEAKQADRGLVRGSGRVLLMDDEDTVRLVCGNMLRTAGYEAELAEHGEEALEKFIEAEKSGNPFDVVILDLTIRGGMGGAETIRNLIGINPAVKAVVSSGYAEDPIVANYKNHGFKAALSKPYRIDELSSVIHDLLNAR